MNQESLENAFIDFAGEKPEQALTMITGLFVSIATAYCEARGHDAGQTLKFSGPEGQRRITIHAEGE